MLCRNGAFTYVDTDGQRAVLARLAGAMPAGAALVVGAHERLTDGEPWLRLSVDAKPRALERRKIDRIQAGRLALTID